MMPTPDTSPDARSAEIPNEIDGVEAMIARLANRLEALGSRLSPVMRDQRPLDPSSPDKLAVSTSTGYGSRLRSLADQVESAAWIVDDLIDRLEV